MREPKPLDRTKFACVLLPLDEPNMRLAFHHTTALFPFNDLHEYGTELSPHITVLYGLLSDSSSYATHILERVPAPTVQFGKVSVFSDVEFDVVKIEILDLLDSLSSLNSALRWLPYCSDYSDYTPHMTLAYVKRGYGARYDGLVIPGITGRIHTMSHIVFSPSDKLAAKTHLYWNSFTGKLESTPNCPPR